MMKLIRTTAKKLGATLLACVFAAPGAAEAAGLEWLRVSDDGKGFVTESGKPFVPWGFNYDHDEKGRLIEDYWDTEWPKVEEDFREMKELGANVVRVHLQTAKFLKSADEPNQQALAQLARLVKLSEEVGIYLDVTGLGAYHKQDQPAWYDELDEKGRWAAQAAFWEAVAETCKDSPAVFFYDLMNEPTVPGKKQEGWVVNWPLGGKYFVQYVTRDAGDRDRTEVAQEWLSRLAAAVRKHDSRHLVTVGMLPWDPAKGGPQSGFVPEKVAGGLDFLCVHVYPERGKVDESVAILKAFAVDKPVIIEEVFPLLSSMEEMDEFLTASKGTAAGWISFYWGETPEEMRRAATSNDELYLKWLEVFQEMRPDAGESEP